MIIRCTCKETVVYNGGIPGEVEKQLFEPLGGAEGVDDPVVAIAVDDRLVEIEHHHHTGAIARGHRCSSEKLDQNRGATYVKEK
jgi:hypothetical protein